jgi:hypothetical protein
VKLPIIASMLLVISGAADAQTPVPSAAAQELARQIAGCYELDDGPWRSDSVRAGDVSTAYTPLSFELTDEQVQDWDSMQSSKHPMFAVRPSMRPWSYWQRAATTPDTIRISRPLAFAGVWLTLTPAGRDLVGTVEAFTDAIERGKPSEVTRPVYARRVACSPVPMRR